MGNIKTGANIYFHYSADVTTEQRQAVKSAVVDLKDKTKKNRAFFINLHMNVCNNRNDLKEHTSFSRYIKQQDIDNDNVMVVTTFSLYNDGIKEIIIKTENSNSGFLGCFKKGWSYNTIYETTLHELGH